ncbi:HAD family hydrolase [Paraglaciecola sp. 2405UD69-4]|uniref:HAD family hydrolase n=1 Tax=Paraglaciecola sp. 2405UD69-4 TaxID=3391836 RepID=UPI0039C9886D
MSFDLFDTLIYRKVSKPTDIFSHVYAKVKDELLLGLHDKEFQELRFFAEKEAKYNVPSNEVSLEEIYDYMPFSQSIKAALLKSELETEALYGFLYEPLLNLITELKAQGIQILFLSDMYLSKEQIHKTFFDQNKWVCDIPLYVSSEYKKNKASGQLFHYVKEQLSLEYSEWLHVGDNLKSDFEVPNKIGLHAIYAGGRLSSTQILKTEKFISPSGFTCNSIRQIAVTHKKDKTYALVEPKAFELGAFVWGPALFAFSDWVIDKTISVKSSTILCLMREAEVFVPLISLRLSQRNIKHIVVKKLFASRKSTIWPSINLDSINWFNDLIALLVSRRGYTVDDFYRDFQLIPDALHSKFKSEFMKSSDGLFYGGRSILNCLIELATNNIAKIEKIIKQQKVRFTSYYSSQISVPYQECTVVDFGYGGTIQHNLQMIFDQHSAANLLFVSSDRVYKHAKTTAYISFINAGTDTNHLRRLLCRSSECIEAFLLGDYGTTLSYGDDPKGTPILAPKLKENTSPVKAFLAGTIEYVNCHHQLGFHKINLSEVMSILLRYVQYPTKYEAELFTQIKQQDNFGSDNSYAVISNEQLELVKRLGVESVYLEFSRNIKWKIDNLHWPQAMLNLLSEEFMQKQHGLLLMDTDNDAAELADRILRRGWTNFTVYGAGVFFEKLLPHLNKNDLIVDMVIDRKAEIFGPFQHLGYEVVSLNQAIKSNCKNIVICSKRFKDEIAQNIYKKSGEFSCNTMKIISL